MSNASVLSIVHFILGVCASGFLNKEYKAFNIALNPLCSDTSESVWKLFISILGAFTDITKSIKSAPSLLYIHEISLIRS